MKKVDYERGGARSSPDMELHAYEMLLNDMYQHLLDPRNVPAKGMNMLKYSMEFIENRKYENQFWFEINADRGHLWSDFKRELDVMLKIINSKHAE